MSKEMQRVTLRMEAHTLEQIDSLVEDGRYPSRSEAIRAVCRQRFAKPVQGFGERVDSIVGDRKPTWGEV